METKAIWWGKRRPIDNQIGVHQTILDGNLFRFFSILYSVRSVFFFFITISLSNQRNLSSTHLWRDITVPALLYICTFVHTWYVHMYVHVHIPRSYRESEHSEVECRMSGEVSIVHCPLSTVHSDCKKLSKKKNEYKLMLFFFIVIQIVLCRNYNYIIRCLQRRGNFPIASVQTSRTHTPTKTWPTCNTTTHPHTHMHRYIVDIRLYAIRSEWSYTKKKKLTHAARKCVYAIRIPLTNFFSFAWRTF